MVNVNETENCENKQVWKILKTEPINREQSLLCTSCSRLMLIEVAEQEVLKGQGRSQNYIKGGSKFSRHRFTDKTLGHQRKRAPSGSYMIIHIIL